MNGGQRAALACGRPLKPLQHRGQTFRDGLLDGITVEDGAVTVNLLPLISRGLTFVQGLGLLDQLDVPELTRDGDPSSTTPVTVCSGRASGSPNATGDAWSSCSPTSPWSPRRGD